MISPKICHCIHPFFREYAPVSTPSSYFIRYSVIKRYSVIVLYKMHIVQWNIWRAYVNKTLYFQRLSQEADEREDEERVGEENKTKAKSELKVE